MSVSNKNNIVLVSFCTLLLFTACQHYYKAIAIKNNGTASYTKTIDSLTLSNRYFILQNGNDIFYMKNLVLSADQRTLQCTLEKVSNFHLLHAERGNEGNRKYKHKNPLQATVINEVHFYTPYDSTAGIGRFSLDLSKVHKIEVIEKDKKRTTNSYVIGAVGLTVGALAAAMIIIMATKSSCPFVSAYDNDDFFLQGEIYGGAIYPQLARHDYMPLKMTPLSDGTLQVKISNELKERQYTDIAELLVITHDSSSSVLADENGNLYTVSKSLQAFSAQLNNKKNVLSALSRSDDNEIVYLDDSTNANATNEVLLKFKNVTNSSTGKLILTLKNSYWVDMLYGKLAEGFGTYYTKYIEQQRNRPVAELKKWIQDQQLPLVVSVNTKKGWKKISEITTIGPLANRKIIVPVDMLDTTDIIEIKLSSGFMFWEIDQAALDLTKNEPFTVERLSPQKANDELGQNVAPQLEKEDGLYLEQPLIGNIANLVYKPTVNKDQSQIQTYILHAKGYYEHIRNFKNKPDVKFLSQFKSPNAFPVYGMQLYNKIQNENLRSLSKGN